MNGGEIKAPASRRYSPGVERARARVADVQQTDLMMLEHEPARVNIEDFRAMLMSCVMSGGSDITISTDQQPRVEIHNQLYRATRRPWGASEVDQVLMETYGGSNARTEINGQKVLDYSYELNLPDGGRQRFRCNATGTYGRDGSAVEITLRALPSITPDLEKVQLTEEEAAALSPHNGIVVISGQTGSGKSTTLAALIRRHLMNVHQPRKIVDIQAPIEYTYRDLTSLVAGSASLIGQSEVGRNIRSFAEGTRSALRRKPGIVVVGEARDYETILATLEVSLTGHAVYTTTHAGTVADTVRRLLSIFPAAERDSRANSLLSTLRFIMVQHLVGRVDKPGVVPIREYIRVTPRLREKLMSSGTQEWPDLLVDEVYGRVPIDLRKGTIEETEMRQSLYDAVLPHFRAGRISREDAVKLGGLAVLKEAV